MVTILWTAPFALGDRQVPGGDAVQVTRGSRADAAFGGERDGGGHRGARLCAAVT